MNIDEMFSKFENNMISGLEEKMKKYYETTSINDMLEYYVGQLSVFKNQIQNIFIHQKEELSKSKLKDIKLIIARIEWLKKELFDAYILCEKSLNYIGHMNKEFADTILNEKQNNKSREEFKIYSDDVDLFNIHFDFNDEEFKNIIDKMKTNKSSFSLRYTPQKDVDKK